MRFIRDIALQIDYEEDRNNPRPYGSDFAFRCRFIGNYLRREVSHSKFEPKGYTRLIINACQDCYYNKMFENALCVAVPFDKEQYDNLSKKDMPDFFIEMYKQGILKAQETHDMPVKFLMDKIDMFMKNNYKNEWEFKSKTFKEIGIKATLFCKMTIDAFTLSLMLFKRKELVFEREILTTLPDETCYYYQFKDIVFENNLIKVTSWYDASPLYVLDLSFNV